MFHVCRRGTVIEEGDTSSGDPCPSVPRQFVADEDNNSIFVPCSDKFTPI